MHNNLVFRNRSNVQLQDDSFCIIFIKKVNLNKVLFQSSFKNILLNEFIIGHWPRCGRA